MRTADNLWNLCQSGEISRSEWDYQRKVVYKGVSYTDSEMKAISYRRSLVDDSFGLGKTIAAELNVSIVVGKAVKVRKNEEVEFYVRIKTKNNGDTPWYKFGKFYIQEASRQADVWTFICYDALILLQREKFTTDTATVSSALNMIASEIGVGIDSRTNIVNDITLDKLKKYTMIEVLGYIASLNYGNIYLTEENNLRLVVPSITGTARAVINDHNTKAISHGAIMDFNKVVLSVSKNSEDEEFVSGTGKNKLEVINPWGSQSLADNIHKIVSRFEMNPKDTSSSEVDIMLELGDLVVIDGDPIQIMSMDYSPRMYLSITSPSDTDKVSKTKSSPSKTNPDPSDPKPGKDEELRDILGISECHIIQKDEIQEDENGMKYFDATDYDCIVIPKEYTQLRIVDNFNDYQNEDRTGILEIKGGSGLVNGKDMFSNNGFSNRSIDISGLITKNITEAENMFYLTSIFDSGEMKMYKLTSCRNMFLNSSFKNGIANLVKMNMNAKDYFKMFTLTSCLGKNKTLSLGNVNFTYGSSTRYMFLHCYFENQDFELNGYISDALGMFEESSFKSIDISNLTFGINSAVKLFKDSKVEKVYLPGGYNGSGGYNGGFSSTFSGCKKLKYINFDEIEIYSPFGQDDYGNILNGTIRSIGFGSTFLGCESMKNIDLSSIKMTLVKDAEDYSRPQKGRADFSGTFKDCINLETVKLVSSITRKDYTSEIWIYRSAFMNTPNLKYIDIRGIDKVMFNTNGSDGFNAFENCGAEKIIVSPYCDVVKLGNKPVTEEDTNGIPIVYQE